jgi:hypothetical protein
LAPYGKGEVSNADIAALAALEFFNMAGDLGVGELRALNKAGTIGKDLLLWKKVGKMTEELPPGSSFMKGGRQTVEIRVSDDLKLKIRPKTNEIVIEGYKRRFGGAKVLPEGAIPEEAKNLIPTIERTTGKQIVARMEGDNLILQPIKSIGAPQKQLMIEAPKAPVKTEGTLFGKGFTATDKADKAMVAQSKALQDYQAARKAFEQKPTPATLKKVLALREKVKATQPPKPVVQPVKGLFEEARKVKPPKVETPKVVSVIEEETKKYKSAEDAVGINKEQLTSPGTIEDPTLMKEAVKTKENAEIIKESYLDQLIQAQKDIKSEGGRQIASTNAILREKDAKTALETLNKIEDELPTKSQATEIWNKAQKTSSREPIPSQGKEKDSRFFKRKSMEKDSKLEGEVKYNQLNLSEDEARAAKKVTDDFQASLDEIRSGTNKPDDTLYNNLAEAIGNKALKQGDYELLNEMARKITRNATRSGQETVSLRGKVSIDTPLGAIRMVLKNRIDNKGGAKKVAERIKNTVKRDMDKVRARAAAMKSAQEIIDSITC